MATRRRKTLVVCEACHASIHGRPAASNTEESLESPVIRNGHAGFGRGVSEKDHKAPRRGPTSADPTGDKARAVKARCRGVCRGCGAPTAPRNGKGDAYAYCKRCHPGAIARDRTRERVREAMRAWPAPSTVIDLHGSWAAAVADAFGGA
jgi:hypothetical protein